MSSAGILKSLREHGIQTSVFVVVLGDAVRYGNAGGRIKEGEKMWIEFLLSRCLLISLMLLA